jgi:hypothetical protein
MITIILHEMVDPMNQITKSFSNSATVEGTLKAPADAVRPVALIETDNGINRNYAQIPIFGRYYFVTRITAIQHNLYEVEFRVDVLHTYGYWIKQLECIAERSSDRYNLYLEDSEMITRSKSATQTKVFPAGFISVPKFLLAVAGGFIMPATAGQTVDGAANEEV